MSDIDLQLEQVNNYFKGNAKAITGFTRSLDFISGTRFGTYIDCINWELKEDGLFTTVKKPFHFGYMNTSYAVGDKIKLFVNPSTGAINTDAIVRVSK